MLRLPLQSCPGRITMLSVAASVALLCGCGIFGTSCAELDTELRLLYNSFIEETTELTAAEILQQCSRATQRCPDLLIAFELAGLVCWKNNRLNEALEHYKKAVSLAPDDQEILEDAMAVAFKAQEAYLYIAADGNIQTGPFSTITLEEYARIPRTARLLWCEAFIAKTVLPGPQTTEIKDEQGKTLGIQTSDLWISLTSPDDLDAVLLTQASLQPMENLVRAGADQLFEHTSFSHSTELY